MKKHYTPAFWFKHFSRHAKTFIATSKYSQHFFVDNFHELHVPTRHLCIAESPIVLGGQAVVVILLLHLIVVKLFEFLLFSLLDRVMMRSIARPQRTISNYVIWNRLHM